MYYFKYADDFIIGVDRSKKDCVKPKNKINSFLQDKLNMVLNLKKTQIIHATKRHV